MLIPDRRSLPIWKQLSSPPAAPVLLCGSRNSSVNGSQFISVWLLSPSTVFQLPPDSASHSFLSLSNTPLCDIPRLCSRPSGGGHWVSAALGCCGQLCLCVGVPVFPSLACQGHCWTGWTTLGLTSGSCGRGDLNRAALGQGASSPGSCSLRFVLCACGQCVGTGPGSLPAAHSGRACRAPATSRVPSGRALAHCAVWGRGLPCYVVICRCLDSGGAGHRGQELARRARPA